MELFKEISTIKDQYGYDTLEEGIMVSKSGIYYQRSLACYSAAGLDLGTCQCHSHAAYTDYPLSLEDCREFEIELTIEQKVSQALAAIETTLTDLEGWCETSYKIGTNPLPVLRKLLPFIEIKFAHHDGISYFSPDAPLLVCWLYEHGTVELELVSP